jgi:hypothetical protein
MNTPTLSPPAAPLLGSLLAASLALTGCNLDLSGVNGGQVVRGSGVVVEDALNIWNVSGLALDAPGTVYVTVGDRESLVIRGEDNLLPYLSVWTENGRLRIEVDRTVRLQPTVPIRYDLTVRGLSRITSTGSGRVEAEGLRGDRLLVSSSGSGGIQLDDVRVNRLSVAVQGSVAAAGRVTLLDANLAGSGPLEARQLESDEASVTVAGSGSANLRVRRQLDVNLSGSGSVLYYGNPRVVQSVTGAGEVRRVGS